MENEKYKYRRNRKPNKKDRTMKTEKVVSFEEAVKVFEAAKLTAEEQRKLLEAEQQQQECARVEKVKERMTELLAKANANISTMVSKEHGDPKFFEYLMSIAKEWEWVGFEDYSNLCGFRKPAEMFKANQGRGDIKALVRVLDQCPIVRVLDLFTKREDGSIEQAV